MIPYPVYSQKLLGFIPFGDFVWDVWTSPLAASLVGIFFLGDASSLRPTLGMSTVGSQVVDGATTTKSGTIFIILKNPIRSTAEK